MQTLDQLIDEGNSTVALIGNAAEHRAQITALHEDLKRVMKGFGQTLGAGSVPTAEAMRTIVATIVGDKPERIATLRVYYTFNGLYRDPPTNPPVTSYPFRKLGSGAEQLVAIKNYRLWVAADGDAGHPAGPSVSVNLQVSDPERVPVDLQVRKTKN